MSVAHGSVHVYRMTSDWISPISERSLDLEQSSDRERYEALLRSGHRLASSSNIVGLPRRAGGLVLGLR